MEHLTWFAPRKKGRMRTFKKTLFKSKFLFCLRATSRVRTNLYRLMNVKRTCMGKEGTWSCATVMQYSHRFISNCCFKCLSCSQTSTSCRDNNNPQTSFSVKSSVFKFDFEIVGFQGSPLYSKLSDQILWVYYSLIYIWHLMGMLLTV